MSVSCLPCAVGFHPECWNPTEEGECHCVAEEISYVSTSETIEKKEHGGQIKAFADVSDLESTGRKRAAKLYPIPKEGQPGYPMVCEWKGLKNAGGGIVPIVGCVGGMAKNIHHGPDKSTLSNFVGNVHRICSTCHNRWHAANDKYYTGVRPSGDVPYLPIDTESSAPHDGLTPASPEDIAASEVRWATSGIKS